MKKLVRTGALLFGACLVWAAGAMADCVHPSTANTGDEARSFAAGGENTEAQGTSATMLSLISSGSENRKANEAFGTHGYTLSAMFHHSEGVGDDDWGAGSQGSDASGSSNCGHGSSAGGGGMGLVSTPEPSSLLLLVAGLLGLLGSTKAIRTKTA